MNKEALNECLARHLKLVNDEAGGEMANLSGANLSGANLSGANLSGANLSGANLKVFHGGEWIAYIDPAFIRIGCKFFTIAEWDGFSDGEIRAMACNALEFWKENKAVIMAIAKQLQEQFPLKEAT